LQHRQALGLKTAPPFGGAVSVWLGGLYRFSVVPGCFPAYRW
jgi:hypothetical protein